MGGYKIIEGESTLRSARIGVIASRFNSFVTERLLEGAIDTLCRHGLDPADIDVVRVPGAYEMPLAAARLAAAKRYDALIALGAVIRGATPHFEYVAAECVRGLAQVGREYGLPVALGVLTVDTVEQAIERAGTKGGNKGAEAALTAIEMINLLRKL